MQIVNLFYTNTWIYWLVFKIDLFALYSVHYLPRTSKRKHSGNVLLHFSLSYFLLFEVTLQCSILSHLYWFVYACEIFIIIIIFFKRTVKQSPLLYSHSSANLSYSNSTGAWEGRGLTACLVHIFLTLIMLLNSNNNNFNYV